MIRSVVALGDAFEGYEIRSGRDSEGFVWSAGADWLATILGAGRTLHTWASEQDDVVSFTGRGAVHAVLAPTGGPDRRERWVVRHYRRGGAVARYLDDRYLAGGDSRPIREFKASVEARSRGVPTPAVVAGAVYTTGMFYRADIVTEFIPDAETLADLLFGGSDGPIDVERMLHIAGKLVRRLEDTHVLHPDVSAGNILVHDHRGAAEAHVIDLDRCNVLTRATPALTRFMRDRLERSLRKLSALHAVEVSDVGWRALRDGFEAYP